METFFSETDLDSLPDTEQTNLIAFLRAYSVQKFKIYFFLKRSKIPHKVEVSKHSILSIYFLTTSSIDLRAVSAEGLCLLY